MNEPNSNEVRVIKKYPNRRLYDTTISSYITLEDVKNLVLNQVEIAIQDAKTGEDITRSILLQIILEQEQGGEHIFSSAVLAQLIRFYGDALQGIIANYFERSLILFAKQQDDYRSKVYNPLSFMAEIAEQNINLWKDLQDGFFRVTMTGTANIDNALSSKNKEKSKNEDKEG